MDRANKKGNGLLPRAWSLVATAPDRISWTASLVPFGLSVAGAIDKVLTGKSDEKTCTNFYSDLLYIHSHRLSHREKSLLKLIFGRLICDLSTKQMGGNCVPQNAGKNVCWT